MIESLITIIPVLSALFNTDNSVFYTRAKLIKVIVSLLDDTSSCEGYVDISY